MRAAKIDVNQPEIVAALRKVGCLVQSLASIGKGCPDLLVAHRARLMLIEVKDGKKPPSDRKLTPDQVKWHALAKTFGIEVHVVESVEQALGALQSGVSSASRTAK